MRKQSNVVEIVGALATRSNKNRRPQRLGKNNEMNASTSSFKIKCYKCGKLGHKSPDCLTKKDESNPKNKDKKQCAKAMDDTFAAYYSRSQISSAEETLSRPWILDSGCTAHLCGDKQSFKYLDVSKYGKINLASEASSEIKGKGTVGLSITNGRNLRSVEFLNTLFVPELRSNLISVAKITSKDHEVLFRRDSAIVFNQQRQIKLTAERRGDLYYINEENSMAGIVETKDQIRVKKWHERLSNLNSRDLVKVIGKLTKEKFTMKDAEWLSQCDVCLRGKMMALPFQTSERHSNEVLQIVYSDVVGAFKTQAANEAKYFVIFVDDYTRWCEVFFLKQKSGVQEAFRMYQAHVERQTGKKINCIQSDNGKEYCNEQFDFFLSDQGIERRLIVVGHLNKMVSRSA